MRLFNPYVLILASLALPACDWVDSTGRGDNNAPETEIILEDGQTAGPLSLQEKSSARITAKGTDTDGVVSNWQWSTAPIAEGDLSECGSVEGYDSALAANSLQLACSDSADCGMQFDLQSSDSGTAVFSLVAPELDSPVGLRYLLTVTDNDGGVGSNDYTFCLLSKNEPPTPEDDTFTLLEGQVLNVTADDINLLSNDKDDNDAASKPLSVDVSASTRPAAANVFNLGSDGSFSYSFSGISLVRDVTDSFEYVVTDGEFFVPATVTINIVARNDPPVANGSFSSIEEFAGVDFSFDFADFFSDPEGNTLGFSVLDGDFPQSGGIALSPIGLLSGAGEALDVGDHTFTLLVSDGVASTEEEVTITILENEPVSVTPIADQTVEISSSLTLAVGANFSDPERQPLRYSMDSEDSAVNLTINSRTGVIAGFIGAEGEYDVSVSASDGFNPPTITTFTFEAEAVNLPPTFSGSIRDQDVTFGRAIQTIVPRFADPEGETLTYRLQGISPTGLVLSTSGRLSGRPRQTGDFSGLRIVATDPGGLFVRSNAFTISVER